MLPSIHELVVGIHDDGEAPDDVADALREMHGHMTTGNYKGAADSMRAAHRLIATEKGDFGGGDGDDLY